MIQRSGFMVPLRAPGDASMRQGRVRDGSPESRQARDEVEPSIAYRRPEKVGADPRKWAREAVELQRNDEPTEVAAAVHERPPEAALQEREHDRLGPNLRQGA